eukprot:12490-Heterococcus_DN1.PRE.3
MPSSSVVPLRLSKCCSASSSLIAEFDSPSMRRANAILPSRAPWLPLALLPLRATALLAAVRPTAASAASAPSRTCYAAQVCSVS